MPRLKVTLHAAMIKSNQRGPHLLQILAANRRNFKTVEGSSSHTAFACEDASLSLNCSRGEVLRIVRAHYGRFSLSVCNSHGQTDGWRIDCFTNRAKDIISERCDGRNLCNVHVSSTVFSDPCPGTYKYAEVKFQCEKEATETPAPEPPRSKHTKWPFRDDQRSSHSSDRNTQIRDPLLPRGAMLSDCYVVSLKLNSPRTIENDLKQLYLFDWVHNRLRMTYVAPLKPPIINSVIALSPTSVQINWTVLEPVLTTAIYWTPIGRVYYCYGQCSSAQIIGPFSSVPKSPPKLVYHSHDKPNEPGTRSHILDGLRPNTTYEIFLKTFGKSTNGPPTNTVSVTTLQYDNKPAWIEVRLSSRNTAKNFTPREQSSSTQSVTNDYLVKNPISSERDTFKNITYIRQPERQWEQKHDHRLEWGRLSEQYPQELIQTHTSDEFMLNKESSNVQLNFSLNERLMDEYRKKLMSLDLKGRNFTSLNDVLKLILPPTEVPHTVQRPTYSYKNPGLTESSNVALLSSSTVQLPKSSYSDHSETSSPTFIRPRNDALLLTSTVLPPTSSHDDSTQAAPSPIEIPGSDASLVTSTIHLSTFYSGLPKTASSTVKTSTFSTTSFFINPLATTKEATFTSSSLPSTSWPTTNPAPITTSVPSQSFPSVPSQSFPSVPSLVNPFGLFFKYTTTVKPALTAANSIFRIFSTTQAPGTDWNRLSTTRRQSTSPTTILSTTRETTAKTSVFTYSKSTNVWITSEDKKEITEDVSDRVCPRQTYGGVEWPATKSGRTVEKNCPNHLIGKVVWNCLVDGWESGGPDDSNCVSDWLVTIDTDINAALMGQSPAEEVAINLSNKMKDSRLSSGDLKKTAMVLLPKLLDGIKREDATEPLAIKKTRMRKFKKACLSTGSSMLRKNNARSWKSLPKHYRQQSATSLVLTVEELAFHSARLIDVGTREVEVDSNIVIGVQRIKSGEATTDVTFPARSDHLSHSDWEEVTDSITIPSDNFQHDGRDAISDVVFTMYKNLEDLIPPQINLIAPLPNSHDSGGHFNYGTIRDTSAVESENVLVVNSRIISASLNGTRTIRRLRQPVRFTLKHINLSVKAVPICSFWSISANGLNGKWSRDGCKMLETNSTHTTCSCNHLTNFAILMDVTGIELSPENVLALRIITFIGCIISVICLTLSWTTFMVFKNLQCDRNTIHKNLVLCLLLAEILFLCGIAQTEPKLLCSIIAGVLHYLFLGAFAWMCLEGVQLYVMLIEVFEQEKSRVKWYYLFGYGVPAIVVAVSAGVYYEGYGTDRHCWLTTERSFIWSFVGPALAVMLINIVMLGIAIYIMCRHSNMSAAMKERTKVSKFSAWLKGALVLVVLLGLTWLLGVVYLNEETLAVAYLFTILNSLQGLFIFIFHCIKNEKVQKEYRKVARRTTWLPNCIRVNYGGYNGVASSSPIASSGSGNFFSKLMGQGKRKRSAASTNSSAKPFLSNDQNRKSDLENSSSRDTSSTPVSLNGYMYTPGYANNQNFPVCKTSTFKNTSNVLHNPAQLAPCCETDGGIAGELSEYLDCSVVDSEFVSEYCQHNMQVSMEEKRYSSGSEDSRGVSTLNSLKVLENDNLSTLSLASSSRIPSSVVSSSELLARSEHKMSTKPLREVTTDPKLNLNQYIIPSSRKIVNNNNLNAVKAHDNLQPQPSEHRSASMNRLTKPAASLSSIPETEHSPQHSSAPNIQFRLGYSDFQSDSASASSTVANSPDSLVNHRHFPVSDYEDISPSSTMGSPSSIKSSLPNLDMLTIECEHVDQDCNKRRHSSETDIQFSPFRFTATEC
ncbi:Adhesion G protein-coupled receptor L3 [Bulinus truncatus]|nr:Adhesion G protein-coupled receptor L3 [Bulinus truncatus]